MKNNRLCAELALLLCLIAVPMGSQAGSSGGVPVQVGQEAFNRTEMHSMAAFCVLLPSMVIPLSCALKAIDDSTSEREPYYGPERMSLGHCLKNALRDVLKLGVPLGLLFEGLCLLEKTQPGPVSSTVGAVVALCALVKALECGLDVSVNERLAHWSVKFDALLGLDVNDPTGFEIFLLRECVQQGRMRRVKAMLAHGADPNYTGRRGSTPLWEAIGRNKPDMVTTLLAHGANVDSEQLYHAIRFAKPAIADRLCQSNTLIDSVCDQGNAIWRECLQRGDSRVARVLASRGLLNPNLCVGAMLHPARLMNLKSAFAAEFSRRKQSIEQSLDRHNVPKDIAGLIASFSDGPAALSLIKQHRQACSMLE